MNKLCTLDPGPKNFCGESLGGKQQPEVELSRNRSLAFFSGTE